MSQALERTERLLGEEAMERLAKSHVAVFGLGGVGGYVCEALVRSGVGCFTLVDPDAVAESNLNRQIIATRETIGMPKAEAMRRHMLLIRPEVEIDARACCFLPASAGEFDFSRYDCVVDAVDMVTAKIELVLRAQAAGTPIVSAMGAGNKLDPGRLRVADIYDTDVCPLARVMRRELRRRGVEHLTVVYSDEPPVRPAPPSGGEQGGFQRRDTPGSAIFVPAAAGLMIAAEVVRVLIADA